MRLFHGHLGKIGPVPEKIMLLRMLRSVLCFSPGKNVFFFFEVETEKQHHR